MKCYQLLTLLLPSELIILLPSEEISVSLSSLALLLLFTRRITAKTTMLIILRLASTMVRIYTVRRAAFSWMISLMADTSSRE